MASYFSPSSFSLTCTVTVGEGNRAEKSFRFEVNLSQTLESFLRFVLFSWARSWHDGSNFGCDPFRNHQVSTVYFQKSIQHEMPRRTKLIDDAKRANPQYRGLIHGTVSIVNQEGIFGIYRGLFPVVRWFSLYFFFLLSLGFIYTY